MFLTQLALPGVQHSSLLSTFPHSWQMNNLDVSELPSSPSDVFLPTFSFDFQVLQAGLVPETEALQKQGWMMDVSSLVQAVSFSDNYSYPTWNSTCLLPWFRWFFRPWWLAWSNIALNLHWRAMVACWMLVQRRNDGGIGNYLLHSFVKCENNLSTLLNMHWTPNDFWNLIKQEIFGMLASPGRLLAKWNVHDMKACHYAMVCGLQGSDAASAMQVLQRMEQMQLSANQVCFSTATRKQREVIFHADTDTRQRVWLNSL